MSAEALPKTAESPEAQELLRFLLENLKDGREFALEQAPLLAQEIVAFGRAWNTFAVAAGVACLIVGVFLCRRLAARTVSDDFDIEKEVMSVIGRVIVIVGCLMTTLITAIEATRPAVMAWFAPRLYLIDQLGKLLGQ